MVGFVTQRLISSMVNAVRRYR